MTYDDYYANLQRTLAADKIAELASFVGSRYVNLHSTRYTLSSDHSYAKPDEYYVGTQLLRQLLRLFNFDEGRIGSYRLEHKLVQAVILNTYAPGLVPATIGAAAAIQGLSSVQASARAAELYQEGFFLKATLGEASGELGMTNRNSEFSDILVTQLNAKYSGTLESESYVFQKRLRIHKEYRVHTFQDEVVENLTFQRHFSVIPSRANAARVNSFAREVLSVLPNALIRDSLYGWDIAENEEGEFNILEANPTGIHQEFRPGFHCSGYFQVPAWSVPCLGRFCLFLRSRYGCEIELISGIKNLELNHLYRLVTLYSANRAALEYQETGVAYGRDLSLRQACSIGYSGSLEMNTLCWIVAENSQLAESKGKQFEAGIKWRPMLDEVNRHGAEVSSATTLSTMQDSGGCIHWLVEQQVKRSPDSIALCGEEFSLTYAELNHWANTVARALIGRGVGPETLVAICLTRSPLLIVALLAVLKAGGAYVPIDPNTGMSRLGEFLRECEPLLLVTSAELGVRFRLSGLLWNSLELQDLGALKEETEDQPSAEVTGRNLCYVLYTSGSTGKPKGVMVEHRSVVNQLKWMQAQFPMGQDDVILFKTPYTFDVSVWDIFWPIISGARVVVAKPEGHLDPTYIARLVITYGVTVIQFVPSMLQMFMEPIRSGVGATLRRVLLIGEALPTNLAMRVRQSLPNAQLINLYGPTETAIAVTSWVCDDVVEGEEIPIGTPMPNVDLYVLDANGKLVTGNEEGEIYVAGVQVARGYRNDSNLTDRKFTRDPFSLERQKAMMYATGDRGRWRNATVLEYRGRIDDQIKFYGHRIEPREIEAILERLPEIRQAIVVCSDCERSEKQLVAFYTSQLGGSSAPSSEDLVLKLAEVLPPALVPSKYFMLETMPTSSTGKIDRRHLRDLANQTIRREGNNFEAEETLTAILSSFLAPRQVHPSLSLLNEGLESIAILRFANKIREVFEVDIDIGWLFTEDACIERVAFILNAEGVRVSSLGR